MDKLKTGMSYLVEVVKKIDGTVLSSDTVKNLVPDEGLTLLADAIFFGGAVPGSWYVGLFEGDYTPTAAITAATIAAQSMESTAYTDATRKAFMPTRISPGVVNNLASRAEFSFTTDRAIRGGFLCSASTKGSTAGVLLSVVRFPSPKLVSADTILRISGGFSFIPAT